MPPCWFDMIDVSNACTLLYDLPRCFVINVFLVCLIMYKRQLKHIAIYLCLHLSWQTEKNCCMYSCCLMKVSGTRVHAVSTTVLLTVDHANFDPLVLIEGDILIGICRCRSRDKLPFINSLEFHWIDPHTATIRLSVPITR